MNYYGTEPLLLLCLWNILILSAGVYSKGKPSGSWKAVNLATYVIIIVFYAVLTLIFANDQGFQNARQIVYTWHLVAYRVLIVFSCHKIFPEYFDDEHFVNQMLALASLVYEGLAWIFIEKVGGINFQLVGFFCTELSQLAIVGLFYHFLKMIEDHHAHR